MNLKRMRENSYQHVQIKRYGLSTRAIGQIKFAQQLLQVLTGGGGELAVRVQLVRMDKTAVVY